MPAMSATTTKPTKPEESDQRTRLTEYQLENIFKHITHDIPTLKNCRQASKDWKNGVDNSPIILRHLPFTITHPALFFDLQISTNPNLKWIHFKNFLPTTKEDLQNLFAIIGPIVENIQLDFKPKITEKQKEIHRQILLLIMETCLNLEHLEISKVESNLYLLEDNFLA